ncbi:MAG: peptidylprolyl isomerase [Gemmatimonadota bacterium]
MMHVSPRAFALAALGLLGALATPGARLGAQSTRPAEEVDRILAVAQDSIILMSQLREREFQLQAQGVALPPDSAGRLQLRRELLDQMVNEQLIVQAALADTTIQISDEQLDEAVRQDLDARIQRAGGQQAFQQILDAQDLTMQAFRDLLKQDARAQRLQQQYMAKQQRNVRVAEIEESEMREFYEANKAQLGRRPATITFRQIIVEPKPSNEADSSALRLADSLYVELLGGADFEELAKRWSDDTSSKPLGGDIGWFRRGSGLVREFEDAAFALFSGQTSPPVRTQFGYHIIKVDRIRGPERKARHILIGFKLSGDDDVRARALADSLLARAQAGESVRTLANTYGSPELPDSLTTTVDQLSSLPLGYAAVLGNAKAGDVLGPITIPNGPTTVYAVVQVIETRPEGEYTFTDLEPQIRQRLSQEKILEELMRKLREESYVEIRM